MSTPKKKTVAVIGHGMVGHRFCEKLVALDTDEQWQIVAFGEEPRAAYDRVGLTQFFAHQDAKQLLLANRRWYAEQGIELHIGDRVTELDRDRRTLRSAEGVELDWDAAVLATGSVPFVPPIPGTENVGVFVYRTIEDLERIIAYSDRATRAVVVGGGLLGLEAAKAVHDLGLETHVVEFAPRLMPRQLDEGGARLLRESIEALGVKVHLGAGSKAVMGGGRAEGVLLDDGRMLDAELVIFSCGIRPRDDLARESGLVIGERGGVQVNDRLETSDPRVYAVGEVALHRSQVYGLVAPGYEMAEIVAANLVGETREFHAADMSAKLKLLGVDVASFGDHEAGPEKARPILRDDPFGGFYRKLLVTPDGKRLLGGVLVGDASDYGMLAALAKGDADLPVPPGDLLGGSGGGVTLGVDALGDDAQVCSCNAVTKGAICVAIRDGELSTVGDVKCATNAGTGCGGCIPMVTDLLVAEMAAAGRTLNTDLCEHFAYTRQELFEIVKVHAYRSFAELIAGHGRGRGCEICKPTVASILASLWNQPILDHANLQDTNDRFLANIQRGGLYSVVPRVPAGEITPEKLIVLGEVAKKFGLYTKITGGQRVDLFGARVEELPDIWEDLIDAGFESGHAYGKALRTVKSCVGTSWCRYGVGDSVSFAVRIENRYKGLRAPHKLKSAVSGCVRECAEAQSKDFGLIATEKGWNLYVCGNGGAKPRHADLLASDLTEDRAIQLIDRFLMYYVHTADKLTRTSVWLDKLEGGIDRLRDVVIEDCLGIGDELERQMQFVVDSFHCEWTEVVRNPERRKQFQQFVNDDGPGESGIEIVQEREQPRPVAWPKDDPLPAPSAIPVDATHSLAQICANGGRNWVSVGRAEDFPGDAGATVKHGESEIAVFQLSGEWYATQNVCPHKRALVLSRGIVGDSGGVPKVACPMHKKVFGLKDGKCLSGDALEVATFEVKVEAGEVSLYLPPAELLDAALATPKVRVGAAEPPASTPEESSAVSP